MKAIERIEEIKQRRQNQFILNRLKVGTENRTEADLKEVRDFMHLIKAPHGKFLNEVFLGKLRQIRVNFSLKHGFQLFLKLQRIFRSSETDFCF